MQAEPVRRRHINTNTHVYKLLNKTPQGKAVINAYNSPLGLVKSHHNAMSRIIIQHEIDEIYRAEMVENGSEILDELKITTERFKELAAEIGNTFSGQKPLTYYRPSVERKNPAGPLYSYFDYIKRVYREKGLLKPTGKQELVNFVPSDSENSKIEWLGRHRGPEAEVIQNWKDTYNARTSLLKSGEISLHDYYTKFLALDTLFGPELLQIDFNKVCPGKGELLFDRWPLIVDFLQGFLSRPNQISGVDDRASVRLLPRLAQDAKDPLILQLLPCIIPAARKRKRQGSSADEIRRLSLKERRDSFFLLAESAGRIQSVLDAQRELLRAAGLTLQPIPVFVGTLDAVQASYVVVNNVRYSVDTPLHAIDLCFKIFWALDCKYPERAAPLWKFIQVAGYKINPKDITTQSTVALLNDIEEILNAAAGPAAVANEDE